MKTEFEDWKLTAYALGELDGPDRDAVEAHLKASPKARQMVEDIRATAGNLTEQLSAQLSGEDVAGLTEAQHQEIEAEAAKRDTDTSRSASKPKTPLFRRRLFLPTAMAASLAIAVGGYLALAPSLSRPHLVGQRLVTQSNLKGIGTSSKFHRRTPPKKLAKSSRSLNERQRATLSNIRNLATSSRVREAKPGRGAGKKERDQAIARTYWKMVKNGKVSVQQFISPSTSEQETMGPGTLQYQASSPSYIGGYEWGKGDGRVADDGFVKHGKPTTDSPAGGDFAFLTNKYGDELYDKLTSVLTQEAPEPFNTERYQPIFENPFLTAQQSPLSTFSIDVDTASYANVRRFLNGHQLPPADAVRIEEMVNYFSYDYPLPDESQPFSVNVETAECPWNADHLLTRIGLQGYEIDIEDRPPANLVFLIDVSGSMNAHNKLPLLKDAMRMLVEQLPESDWVAMVVYAGASGLVLDSTSCENKGDILAALDRLRAGGSTNGEAGIELAYTIAEQNFIDGGINRVILATDGDFNVGLHNQGELTRLITEKAVSGVFLSALGFGMGNYQDATLETLADKGNGNYAYIDTLKEAQKVLVDQLSGTLMTIAKDVKIQIEFNPNQVAAYRLIGYENRMLAAQDFNDDTKDAGEIGAGHTVTALYEIIPAGTESDLPSVDPLKYQVVTASSNRADNGELMTVKLRYKEPAGDTSKLIEMPVTDRGTTLAEASDDFAFAAAVASFGMLLRHSEHVGEFTLADVVALAESGFGEDTFGYRAEFVQLVHRATELTDRGR